MALFDWLRDALSSQPNNELGPADLPHWARVAFAARCARYVQGSFTSHWPNADVEHVQALEDALEYAEESAANAAPNGDPKPFVLNSMIAAGAAFGQGVEISSLAASATRVALEAIEKGIGDSAFKSLEALSYATNVRNGQELIR